MLFMILMEGRGDSEEGDNEKERKKEKEMSTLYVEVSIKS